MTDLKQLPNSVKNETFAGYTYHIDGELVPTLTVNLKENDVIYFEQHVLLWKHTSIKISLHTLKGVVRRAVAGIPILITDARGPGQISLSRDGVGHLFAIHLKQGESIHVRENQFVAATSNVEYTFTLVRGFVNMFFGGSQFFIDKFHCVRGDGILWLHGYGNVFEKILNPDEEMDIAPGAWVCKSPDLRMDTKLQKISTIFVAGGYLLMNRFTGPGRIALQSMNIFRSQITQNPLSSIMKIIWVIFVLGVVGILLLVKTSHIWWH